MGGPGRHLNELAEQLLYQGLSMEVLMLEAIRKARVLPTVPAQTVAAAATFLAFGWLLFNDLIQPLAVFLLQLFLSF